MPGSGAALQPVRAPSRRSFFLDHAAEDCAAGLVEAYLAARRPDFSPGLRAGGAPTPADRALLAAVCDAAAAPEGLWAAPWVPVGRTDAALQPLLWHHALGVSVDRSLRS